MVMKNQDDMGGAAKTYKSPKMTPIQEISGLPKAVNVSRPIDSARRGKRRK